MANPPDLRSEIAATEQAVREAQNHLAELTEYLAVQQTSYEAQVNGAAQIEDTPESPSPTVEDGFDVTL